MSITSSKRKQMETLIYDVFTAIDKTGGNTKFYKGMFQPMSDAQFDSFFKSFFADKMEYLVLHICDYERDLRIEDCEKAADVLGIPLMETVFFPHSTMDKTNVVATPYKVAVGYLNIKRTQQTAHKKNGMSTNTSKRSALTNQVVDSDKNGRESDIETAMLSSLGAKNIMRELMGPRADDNVMKQQMYSAINSKGFVSLDELESNVQNKTTLNTADVYITGMTLKSDLVTKSDMNKHTLKVGV